MANRFTASNLSRLLLPPVIPKLLQRVGTAEWEYVADRWPVGDPRTAGWDDASVVDLMRRNWPAYKRTADGTAPLAGWPWTADTQNIFAHNVLMIWGYVLARAAHGKPRVSVLDWGGALGNYALAGRALVKEVAFDFTVKERPALCEAGQALLPDVRFTSSDDDCLSRRYDLVMASGALQYNADWPTAVRRLADAAESWLYLTVLPIVRDAPSFVAVQRPQRHGLKADYLSWVFNLPDLLATLEAAGLTLDREFITGDAIRYRKAPEPVESMGLLLRRA